MLKMKRVFGGNDLRKACFSKICKRCGIKFKPSGTRFQKLCDNCIVESKMKGGQKNVKKIGKFNSSKKSNYP